MSSPLRFDLSATLLDKTGLNVITQGVDGGEIEKGLFVHGTVFVDDLDAPDTLYHKETARAVTGIGHVDWITEAVGYLHQGNLRIARQGSPGSATWSTVFGASLATAIVHRAEAQIAPKSFFIISSFVR